MLILNSLMTVFPIADRGWEGVFPDVIKAQDPDVPVKKLWSFCRRTAFTQHSKL